jgi:hypothetical protein
VKTRKEIIAVVRKYASEADQMFRNHDRDCLRQAAILLQQETPSPVKAAEFEGIPWPVAKNVYGNDGPEDEVTFSLRGHALRVWPTPARGVHSGRIRYHVECITCGKVIHKATTGPRHLCWQHVKESR